LNRNEIEKLIEDLQELLDRIRQGEFDSSSGMLLRIEGAVKALEIVLGDADPSDLV
jgi:hypothetical protein